MKENKAKLYDHVLKWTDEIDNFSYIMTMGNKEDQETARSIQNLLERAMENWKQWRYNLNGQNKKLSEFSRWIIISV